MRVADILAKAQRKVQKLERSLKRDLIREVAKLIRKNPRIVLFYQEQQLFRKSIDANGQELGFYSRTTEIYSNGKKQEGQPYTMIDTGAFKRGLFVDVKYNKLIISSTVSDLDEILDNKVFADLDLFDLTEDSERRMMETHIKPFVSQWMKERLSELYEA